MIEITDKQKCNGCNTCVVACPVKDCMDLSMDNEGFFYPTVNVDTCIDCDKCDKKCPYITKQDAKFTRFDEPKVFASYSNDHEIRVDSTSGGIFSELAMKFFEEDGYVSGAVYNENHHVSHIITNNQDKLRDIRSSKYVFSCTENVFPEIKSKIRSGKKVLVCGAPCQIHGLYAFLGNRDNANLTTIDFICRGVNSTKVWVKYINWLEDKYKSKVSNIKAKDKTHGWHRFSMRVDFENGESYVADRYTDPFFIGYLQTGLFTMPACFTCEFKGFPQKADITLADFWGIENIDKSMDQDLGTSLVLVNSSKGEELFSSVQSRLTTKEFKLKDAEEGNPAMYHPLTSSERKVRDSFYQDIEVMPFDKVANKYFPMPTFKNKLKRRILSLMKVAKILKEIGFSIQTLPGLIKYNFMSKNLNKVGRVALFPLRFSRLELQDDSKINLSAKLFIGMKQVKSSNKETRLLLEEGATLTVSGNLRIYSGSYIRVLTEGILHIEGGFINEDVEITCGKSITIGKNCTIARGVVIRDYDAHEIISDDYEISKPINIGDNVWIGNRAMILKGVKIGSGSVIAAGAVVTKDVPENSVVAGVPAVVIKKNTTWK